jgi:prepilin-type N-terminal cleavage/methylation domain-containing protein
MHCKRIGIGDFRKGVSLTELLVVIAIMAVIACISVPVFSRSISNSDLELQTVNISGAIQTARVKAMEQKCGWKGIFDPEVATFTFFADKNVNGIPDIGEEQMGPFRLENRIKFGACAEKGPNDTEMPGDGISFVDNRLILNSMGSSNAGTVYLTNGIRTSAVRVMPASGAVVCWIHDGTWRKK